MRHRVNLSPAFKVWREHFLALMAEHGASHFIKTGARIRGFGSFYDSGPQAMRPAFAPGKPALYFQWSDASWNALLADRFLEDYDDKDDTFSRWALEATTYLESDLPLGNVVLDAARRHVVEHEEIEGCTASILYQRPGQWDHIKEADHSRAEAA